MTDEIIGDYKIDRGMYFRTDHAFVHKALGPWPMRNWSWTPFYDGTHEECRKYIRWASRIYDGDKNLIEHAVNWWFDKYYVDEDERENHPIRKAVEHLPAQAGYDFTVALKLFPNPPKTEINIELLFFFIAVPVLLFLGLYYHSL